MNLFSRQKESVMGIDISASAIKLVELSHGRSGYELKAIANIPLPRDAIVENTVIDSIAVSQALLDALDKSQTKLKNVSLAVSGNAVIVKVIQVPTTTEFNLETQIEFEADQHVPFDIEDVYLDFQILGETEEDPETMDVVLVACKREIVDDYQLVLSEAGLTATCVDCAVFALENAVEETGIYVQDSTEIDAVEALDGESEGGAAYALVNIGANIININIMRDGQMAFVRDQFYGGQNLTEAIQKAHGLSFQAAEEMKKHNFAEIEDSVREEFFSNLGSEIGRSLDFYGANHAEFPVQKILLSGGSALIEGIEVEMDQRLGIEAEILNPFDGVKISEKNFDVEEIRAMGPMMMIPIGLAMRSFDV
ncbi:MAG: type IV pilus assembly protein PilM [Mariprofundaceae bacterium]|nr:type IV pilus assembly protein PilM [Mariprofundaceae bacterium]